MINKLAVVRGTILAGLAISASTAAFAQSVAQTAVASRQWPDTVTSTPQPLQRDLAAIAAARTRLQLELSHTMKSGTTSSVHRGTSVAAHATDAGQSTTSALAANPYRAYPPSCLANPLPDTTSGVVGSTAVNLAEYVPASGSYILEGVTIYVWRVACSSSSAPTGYNSALLMRIQRQAQYEGDTQYPIFPDVRMAQTSSGIGFDDPNGLDIVRIATEPNTIITTVYPEDPIVYSTTYVLEYFADDAYNVQDYSKALSLRYDNYFSTGNQFFLNNFPAYAPTSTTYPAAFEPQPLSGYLSGNFYDPNHDGEGINIEIGEFSATSRYLSFNWFTFDDLGAPFWLSGAASFNVGDTTVAVDQTFYSTNGGFGGTTTKPPLVANPWGSVTFTYPDCNHLTMTYAANSGLPAPVPSGTKTLNWTRLTSLNGLACE